MHTQNRTIRSVCRTQSDAASVVVMQLIAYSISNLFVPHSVNRPKLHQRIIALEERLHAQAGAQAV
jgi:hypothetical protein